MTIDSKFFRVFCAQLLPLSILPSVAFSSPALNEYQWGGKNTLRRRLCCCFSLRLM